jgi:hypothetical protein
MRLVRRPLTLVPAAALLAAALGCNPPPDHVAALVTGAGAAGGTGSGAAGSGGCAGLACPDAGPGASACPRSQSVLGDAVVNARDLGGIPLAPSGSVACGAILRGPPLGPLDEAGCAAVAALGLETVIDLRLESERLGRPEAPCVSGRIVTAPLPIPYSVSPSDYQNDFATDASIATVFRTLGDPANYPVYLHCTWGRDRTGVVSAAILLALGASRSDVMAEYNLSTDSVGAYPESLAAVLDDIDQQGGIDAALQAKGISADDVAALRARAARP